MLGSIPAPDGGGSGLTWAEGRLWVGQYRNRKIHQIDPESGEILRTIESSRFVTGVTWLDGELWHGTWEGDESDLRRVDAGTGEVKEQLAMPAGTMVSGLESNGRDRSSAAEARRARCAWCDAAPAEDSTFLRESCFHCFILARDLASAFATRAISGQGMGSSSGKRRFPLALA